MTSPALPSSAFVVPDYDDDNIFARILDGRLPCARLYEDNHSLAFLDVMPQIRGHTLVIPKARTTCLFDITPEALAAVMQTIRLIAPGLMRAMDAEGFMLRQFNGTSAGQTVFHFHFHILPRRSGDKLKHHAAEPVNTTLLHADAERIRREIARDAP